MNNKRKKISKNTKFNVYCEDWLTNKTFKSESTKYLYERTIKNHIKPFFKNYSIKAIRKYEIEDFKRLLLQDLHLSTHTVNLNINILRALFNDAVKNCIIQFSPTRAVKSIEYKKKDIEIPNKDECIEITKILINNQTKYKFPLLFGWFAGLRRGEALAVRWENINLKNNTLLVKYQIVNEHGRIVVKSPKRNEIRTVFIVPMLKAELVKIPIEQRKGFVLSNSNNLNPDLFGNYFRNKIKPLIKIKNFHDFRHILFTKLLSSPEIPINTIKYIAGHSSINITTEIYGHKPLEKLDFVKDCIHDEYCSK